MSHRPQNSPPRSAPAPAAAQAPDAQAAAPQPAALWSQLCARFAQAFPPQRHAQLVIVVAVSGGADSVALLRLLVELWDAEAATDRRHLIVAHYNHGVRGEAAAADQRFVAQLAASLGLEFVTETFAPAAAEQAAGAAEVPGPEPAGPPAPAAITSEQVLRRRRYRFLRRTVAARGARYLLTAHTAEDQIETLLHHLFRGTGPAGLCGIPAVRPFDEDFVLLRPLLNFSGELLRAGLREIGQSWREDHSNQCADYQRNWIRSRLLPQIRSRYPAADASLLRLIELQSQWHQTLGHQAQQWLGAHAVVGQDGQGRPQVLLRRGAVAQAILALALAQLWDRCGWPRQELNSAHYSDLTALVNGQRDAAVNLPGAIQAQVCDQVVRIGRI